LGKYAWYLRSAGEHTWPVGGKKPNDLGLFDLHGNVYTWCQDANQAYPGAGGDGTVEDREGDLDIADNRSRILRGGAWLSPPWFIRSAFRFRGLPEERDYIIGFRPARTFPGTP
jgi:formylglycine-generating enzyme required for sulfatase activity